MITIIKGPQDRYPNKLFECSECGANWLATKEHYYCNMHGNSSGDIIFTYTMNCPFCGVEIEKNEIE